MYSFKPWKFTNFLELFAASTKIYHGFESRYAIAVATSWFEVSMTHDLNKNQTRSSFPLSNHSKGYYSSMFTQLYVLFHFNIDLSIVFADALSSNTIIELLSYVLL